MMYEENLNSHGKIWLTSTRAKKTQVLKLSCKDFKPPIIKILQ